MISDDFKSYFRYMGWPMDTPLSQAIFLVISGTTSQKSACQTFGLTPSMLSRRIKQLRQELDRVTLLTGDRYPFSEYKR